MKKILIMLLGMVVGCSNAPTVEAVWEDTVELVGDVERNRGESVCRYVVERKVTDYHYEGFVIGRLYISHHEMGLGMEMVEVMDTVEVLRDVEIVYMDKEYNRVWISVK